MLAYSAHIDTPKPFFRLYHGKTEFSNANFLPCRPAQNPIIKAVLVSKKDDAAVWENSVADFLDVSNGVDVAPGMKCSERIAEFVQVVSMVVSAAL